MVRKQRGLFVGILGAAVLTTAAAPALGGYSAADPNPIRQEQLVRVLDVASTKNLTEQPTVAVGWREGSKPGVLYMSFSIDGGETYRRNNGNLRQWAVAGQGNLGLTVDVCRDEVWAGSAANFPGDRANDTDVLVTRRAIGGTASQVFVTAPATRRKVRDVSVACVGKSLLAIGWLEQSGGTVTARLMLRDLESLAPSATVRKYNLGAARYGGGISVTATARSVHVAWTRGKTKNIRYRRFIVGTEAVPKITAKPTVTLASLDALRPELAIHGQKVVAAYTDRGKVMVRVSKTLGKSFGAPRRITNTGTLKSPSRVHSVDVYAQRIVVELSKSAAGKLTPQRVVSNNLGETWGARSFGHNGPRLGALRKVGSGQSMLAEIWLNNGPTVDTLRAQFESP